jgi:hypothetical protein
MGDCSSCRRRHWVLMTCSEPKSPLSDRPVTTPDWCNYYEPLAQAPRPTITLD